MTDLVAFLNARLDEDEQVAQAVQGHALVLYADTSDEALAYIDRWPRARVIAEATAKRAIVAKFERACHQANNDDPDFRDTWDEIASTLEGVLMLHVQPFVDHPDFDPAWKP